MKLEELELLREGWAFEAKLASGRDGRGALPKSMWETYSAMANSEGGLILLGAKERHDGSLQFVGLADLEKVEHDLWNLLQDPKKVSANVLRQSDVERLEIDGKGLLLLRIPKASRADRPVFINGSWEQGTFLRVHAGDRRVSQDVARRMLADSVKEFDSGVIDGFSIDDLDPDSVRRFRQYFAARRADHPFLQDDELGFLVAIGALRRVRGESAVMRPTWAGLWMLGRETAIREHLPHWHLSYKEVPDDPRDPRRWLDRVYPDGSWNANLFEFYLRIIVKLHDGLKVPFRLTAGQFRMDESPVHDALREALVNALVHADYQGTTGVRVINRSVGFELVNPGLLLITPEQVWRGGVSEPRNPALQRLFGFLRLGEREGSGGPTMRRVWREQHWRAPRIWEDMEHGETHLQLPQESLFPPWAVEALVARWADRFTGQDELGRVILVAAEIEGSLGHGRLRELSDAHPRDISAKLQELVRLGLLESKGRTRGTMYSPSGLEKVAGHSASSGRFFPLFPPELLQGDESPPQSSPQSSPQSEADSPQSSSNSRSLEDTSEREMPSARVARVANSAWARSEDVRAAIRILCKSDFLTVREIADRLQRKATTIQQNYLSKMLAAGELEARYPETPSHPAQAYRVPRTGGASSY